MKIKTRYIILIIIILSLALFLAFCRGNDPIEVKTSIVERGTIVKTVDISGKIEASDFEEISIASGSKVIEVLVEENDIVEAGDVLAVLDSSQLMTSLEKTKLNMDQLKSDLENLSDADDVDRRILENQLDKAEESYNQSLEDYEKSLRDLEKNKTLYEENVISKASYENYLSAFADAKSRLEISRLDLENSRKNLESYDDDNDSLAESLRRQIKSVEIDIKDLEDSIEDNTIKAGISGIVTEFSLKENRTVPEDTFISIHSDDQYNFIGYAPQEDAILVKEGQNVEITVKGVDRTYSGTVSRTGRTAGIENTDGNSKTPRTEIVIGIDSRDDNIYPGFDGDARITVSELDEIIVVKRESVKKDDGGSYVFAVVNRTASKKYVETGIYDDYRIAVTDGLLEGEEIIDNPSPDISNGQKIMIREE
ncbi:Multidrug efflux pump subunit AcrA (membrane-fusion protein) [Dethiosulfatibacter aminovorans DSM 17477]|uniref:Multidrug efflux pump subunit AcrA (Membrane-fusion protein) n=1 Tax=Dethiosulfatibacter aminovorans DSM 17477 TaxID=1121476 RepID=A0A1M6HDE5_9FIRM|nr:biotin/lipoyl-binding protein [Dethiosulfatibacter aminovorans]SHJ20230.1 Multidrug efflux pump subunit AcrA (membrane-fusion protein) [Dethiosulfatibacter aminovorans DSM 17477]